jgi:hypothetical protein
MLFHLHTLKKMQDIANKNNFIFINVFIYTGRLESWGEEAVYGKILEEFCQEQGIYFYNLRNDFAKPLSEGKEIFLKNDGHFTDYGARVVAESLSHHILQSDGGWR